MTERTAFSRMTAAILEAGVNRALKHDPATQLKLAKLSGCVLQLVCTSPDVELFFVITEGKIRVLSHCESAADVSLSGQAIDFLGLIGESPHSLADADITVSGKVSLLNHLKGILSGLEIDWEDMLADIIGVLPANVAAQTARTSRRWFKQQQRDLRTMLPEYLIEELKVVPSKTELEIFFQEVDELWSAAQRAEAKLQRIRETLKKNL